MIKKILVVGFVFFVLFANITFAYFLPFGGRITTIKTPSNITCPGDVDSSPFNIQPVGMFSPGPYSAMYGRVNVGQILTNVWSLGLYRPSTSCFDSATGAPYPTFETDFYGTSFPGV